MKKFKRIISLSIVTLVLLIYGCNQDGEPGLFEPEPEGSTPVISNVIPENSALAGVTEVTINGSNFSSNPDNNFVYFGTAKANVLQASPNELIVRAPVLIKDNIEIKIAVHEAENFSNTVAYNLLEAVGEYYPFKEFEKPYGLTTDALGNIYVSLVSANVGQGIMKISPEKEIINWAPKGGETFFHDIKYNSDNKIYAVRNVRAVFVVEENNPGATFAVVPNGNFLITLDFDSNGNLWTSGRGGNIFSIKPDQTVNSFSINYDVRALRVFDGHLYVSGRNDSEEAIYRFEIQSAESLGPEEKYFDLSGNYGLNTINIQAITFAQDGDLYLGSDQDNAIIIVHPDKTFEDLYPGLLKKNVYAMAWGTDENLYYSKESIQSFPGAERLDTVQTIIKVNMQKLGAPYYGRD